MQSKRTKKRKNDIPKLFFIQEKFIEMLNFFLNYSPILKMTTP